MRQAATVPVSIEYRIICDGCGIPMAHCDQAVIPDGRKAIAAARREVRRDGGRTNLPKGKDAYGRDLCRECIMEGNEPD